MSAKEKTWPRYFKPDETGFSEKLLTKEEHLRYLQVNKLKNYLNKVDYPEDVGGGKLKAMAKDFGYKLPSSAFYMIKKKPEEFIAAVRGFIYYRSKRKSVHIAEATAKGMSMK
jgi:hypothetical protein